MTASTDREHYFVAPNPVLAIVVLFGLWLVWCLVFAPDLPPHKYMGPVGQLYTLLAFEANPFWKYGLCIASFAAHIGESFIAIYVTGKKGVTDPTTKFKWWLSTLMLGIFSMRHLLKLKNKEQ